MIQSIYLFGIGTTAFRIKSFIEYHNLYKVAGFIVDDAYKTQEYFCDLKVFSVSEFETVTDFQTQPVFICTAWNRLNQDRKDIFNRLKNNYNLINLIAPTAIIRGEVQGGNIFIGDYVIIEPGSSISSNVFIDHHAFVGTFGTLEEHVYLGAKSMLAGHVSIGRQAFIGISAVLFDQVAIGEKCIISGGEIIKRSIPNYTIVKKSSSGIQEYKTFSKEEILNKLQSNKNVR